MRIESNNLFDGHISLGIYSYIVINEDESETRELVIGLLLFDIVIAY
jgi:hypothetical protein